MEKKQFWKGVLAGVVATILVCALFLGIIFAREVSNSAQFTTSSTTADSDLDLETISKNINLLETYIDNAFILDYDKADLEQGIYEGLVAALGDPYSAYYTPEEAAELTQTMNGTYAGIGATISENADGDVVVVRVFSDAPAAKAGVCSGDVVIGVDFESVAGLSSDEVVDLVRGEEGTTLTLNVTRDGERMDFEITREIVNVEEVSYEMMSSDVAYMAISQFVGTAADEVENALTDLKSQGATKLVIDLRNNTGGSLDVLLQTANYFLDSGETIIKEIDKRGNEDTTTADGGKIWDGDIVILTNGYTASAAECFTAALHDNGKAEVVGTQTFGKGIVQQSYTLSTGAILKLTTEYYYTPNDVCIHKVGITPDYVLEYDASSGEDNQLAKAVEVLN